MASFNQATVIGFVGDEPRIIQTQSNTSMTTLSIATTDKGYQRQDGKQVEERTEWHNIVFFGKQAEIIAKFVHKGSSLMVQGKLRTRTYEDKNNASVKHYVTEIICENFQLLDRKQDNNATSVQNTHNAQATNSVTATPYGYPQPTSSDPDLPF